MMTKNNYLDEFFDVTNFFDSYVDKFSALKQVCAEKLVNKDEKINELTEHYELLLMEKDSIIETLKSTNQCLLDVLSNNNGKTKKIKLDD